MHLAGDVGSLPLGSTPPSVDSPEVTFLTELGPRCGKLSALSFAAEGASLEAGLWMGTPLVGLRGDIPTGLRRFAAPHCRDHTHMLLCTAWLICSCSSLQTTPKISYLYLIPVSGSVFGGNHLF